MSLAQSLYSTLFRKNYTMLAAVFGAGFAWEIGFNATMNKIWDSNNRGRQWKDIRHKYVEGGEDEE
ncbi:ubiquinol-cytochrome C reductase [Trichoderma chlorosporum]